jgi:hypothetical protein
VLVYVAWRGATIHGATVLPPQFTFWSRKHSAHVVGDNGAATALFEGIRTAAARNEQSTAVFVGHSFGGALLFSAMGNVLNGALEAARDRGEDDAIVDLGGALFVLVNPAFEGSRMANIFTAANAMHFSPRQLPVLLTMASESDYAVKLAFPIGQSLATWQRSVRNREQWQGLLQGAGLYKPFHTHVLEAKPGQPAPKGTAPDSPCACRSGLRAQGDALISELVPVYRRVIAAGQAAPVRSPDELLDTFRPLSNAAYREFRYSTLEPTLPVDPNSPFLTVKVDNALVGDHGDIFNTAFLDFLFEWVALSEGKRNLVRATTGASR